MHIAQLGRKHFPVRFFGIFLFQCIYSVNRNFLNHLLLDGKSWLFFRG